MGRQRQRGATEGLNSEVVHKAVGFARSLLTQSGPALAGRQGGGSLPLVSTPAAQQHSSNNLPPLHLAKP